MLRQNQMGVMATAIISTKPRAEALDLRLGPGVDPPARHGIEHHEADAGSRP
jgi:hypothetical protein